MAKPQSMEMFDAYFQRADLDRDGRISGAEAVSFFQGSKLPKPVLAQIWMHADQNRVGFLGRKEFHNALRLVTVAQSGRELTPDIVEAALFGPAAAKIPPPQMNTVAGSASQTNSLAAPGPQMVAPRPSLPQNFGFRGGPQVPPNAGMNQQFFSSPENQYLTPQAMPSASSFPVRGPSTGLAGAGSLQAPRFPNSNAPRVSSDWLGARPGGVSMEPPSQAPNKATPSTIPDAFGLVPSGPSLPIPSRPLIAPGLSPKSQDPAKDSKALVASGNGFSSDSIFGGDIFSATQSQHKQTVSTPPFSAGNVPNSSVLAPAASRLQPAVMQSQPDPFASMVSLPSSTSQLPQAPSGVKPSQLGTVHSSSGPSSSSVPVGAIASESSKSLLPWPKMTVSDVAKYTKVFVEVDTDRDGKITGEQARNLFLSWRLPREVLKQVWDLSDQDSDSMLSLREFCTALYLMERFRDGRPLPEVLPDSVKFDSVLPPAGQLVAAYGGAAWGPTPGVPQQGMSARRPPVAPSSGPKILPQVSAPPQADDAVQPIQRKSRVPVLEKHLTDQLSKEEQSVLNSKFQEATNAEKKVEELEKEILDSQQKIEFYRTKMQELVLYKSRCDNRLNEVMERVIADKHEVEILGKKYEEKCRQVGDVASKLTIEEATFRDIQEKKMKLYTTIAKMGQGGAADGSLQVRADQIQSDLEGLVKALNERCKKYGIRVKRTILVELPLGWQPSIQDGAADWDEDWDKFEDEGFTTMKEVDVDEPNITVPPQTKSNLLQNDKASADELFTSSSPTNGNSEKPLATGEQVHESGSVYAQSEEDLGRSPAGSPEGRGMDSPSREFSAAHFGKDVAADASPRDKETDSDHAAGESTLSRDRYTDEHSWGPTFDANDDTDSVWGFGSKEPDLDGNRDNSFFGSEDLDLNPIRTTTDSPRDDNMFQKKSPFFADSVPGTPLFNSSSPPRFSQGSEEHSSFDNFSRFDSFNHDSGFFAPQETLARFDSIRSTRDSGGFTSFDDSDPFNSTGPFKSSETQTSRRGSDNWSAF